MGEPALRLELPQRLAARSGRQIWLNETGGRADAITSWNDGEQFASMGIGHFIWYPASRRDQFAESFPGMMAFVRTRGKQLPGWLDKQPFPACPWSTKVEFLRDFRSPQMVELRGFLTATFGEQTLFMTERLRRAPPRMMATLPDQRAKGHVHRQFARVASASETLYPLLDYVNFKGEGTSESETFVDKASGQRVGWGLKQVLLAMQGTEPGQPALDAFAEAAKAILQRRIANNPPSKRWEAGWMKRCDTYRRPPA